MNRMRVWSLGSLTLPFLALAACSSPEPETSEQSPGAPEGAQASMAQALTFHASFDHGPAADFARGDPELYTAPSWDESGEAVPGLGNPDVHMVPGRDGFGTALQFTEKNTSAIFYKAEEKVAYSGADWSGTVSFWLSLTPDQDLAPGYCDPIQITDEAYNDAAVWVDFTNTNPRQFRLGVFGDLESWNPEGLSSDENPGFQEKLVVVEEPPFERESWTHVVITYSGLGSGSNGTARLYLDGLLQGEIQDILEPFSWDLAEAQLRIGVNYIGAFDELALFDRPLTEGEVTLLHGLQGGVTALHP